MKEVFVGIQCPVAAAVESHRFPRGLLKGICFLFFFLNTEYWMLNTAKANNWKSLQSGDQVAKKLLDKFSHDKQTAGKHPLDEEASQWSEVENPDVTQMLREKKVLVKIDPEHDPLMRGSEKLMKDPLTAIGGEGTHVVQVTQGGQDETLTCEEPGENSLQGCTEDLHVQVIKEINRKEWGGDFYFGHCKYAEHYPYLSCQALRAAVSAASRGLKGLFPKGRPPSMNITGVYKACMAELAARRREFCNMCRTILPALPFPTDKIREVSLLPNHHDPKQLFVKKRHFHMYNSGNVERYSVPFINVIYEEETYRVSEGWVSNCQGLENLVDQGMCSYGTKACSQGHQTRVINGHPVTRGCWQYTFTYHCEHPCQNNCGPLRARGCEQIQTACKQMIDKTCVVHTQTYQCKGNKTTTDTIVGGNTPFCLDGTCRDQSFERNDEMMSSLAQLSLLKEMQGKLGTLFKGTTDRCSRAVLDFKDCCGSGSGWGVGLGLAGCGAEEKNLQLKRKNGLCHFVGTHCSQRDKVFKICLQKKSTYCCFGSKLLKAFHEQGRPQIGMGWGTSEDPLCRGFTVEEIQLIDFSKLDLREAFEDLMKNFKSGKMEGTTQKINERMEIIKKGLRPKTKPQKKQRGEA